MNIMRCMLIGLCLGWALFTAGCGPAVSVPWHGQRVMVTDDEGTTVQVPRHPQKIVTLTSAYDTILLGMVAPQRMAAVSSLVKYPAYSLSAPQAKQVGMYLKTYSLEHIVSLHPDLVIVPEYASRDVVDSLRGMGIPTVVVRTRNTVAGTETTIRRLAEMVGEQDKGERLIQEMKADLAKVATIRQSIPENERRSAVFLSSMSGYAGTGSLFDDMCRYMGIVNAPSAKGYPPRTDFTDERMAAMNPDALLVPVYTAADKKQVNRFYQDKAFSGMQAVRNKRVEALPAAYLYTSNQYIGKAMLGIIQAVYPERFEGQSNRE